MQINSLSELSYCLGQQFLLLYAKQHSKLVFNAEIHALKTLSGVTGVPRIEAICAVEEHEKFQCYSRALIASPVGNVLRTDFHRVGQLLNGTHLQKLVEIVQQAHTKKLLHRDIKPDNAFLTEQYHVLPETGSTHHKLIYHQKSSPMSKRRAFSST